MSEIKMDEKISKVIDFFEEMGITQKDEMYSVYIVEQEPMMSLNSTYINSDGSCCRVGMCRIGESTKKGIEVAEKYGGKVIHVIYGAYNIGGEVMQMKAYIMQDAMDDGCIGDKLEDGSFIVYGYGENITEPMFSEYGSFQIKWNGAYMERLG